MIEISINKVIKNFGFKNVLDNISLEIQTNDKVALIGENGCGKSTLLNIISGEENVTSGTISIRKGRSIGYLKQIPVVEEDISVKDFLYTSVKEILDIKERLNKYEQDMASASGKDLEVILNKYANLQERYQSLGGYEIDSLVGKIIGGFKLENLLDKSYNVLSSGEKRIVFLAKIMISSPDILLLDEPTNHLDIDTLSWFEDYLNKYPGTVLLVSHDRYFIDKVATKTILIERGKEVIFFGNYSYYIKENEARLEKEFKDYKDQQKMIEEMNKKIKKLEEFGRLASPLGGEQFFKRAESIRKRIERIELKDKPIEPKNIPLNFDINNRSGNDVLVINKLDLTIGDTLLVRNINAKIRFKECVCIMGKNGSGKSTLIKKILSNDDEHIIIGSNVKIGYMPQEIKYDEDITILDFTKKFYEGDETHLRSTLNKFYFHGENVFKKINKLSGGEKVRLKLLELIQEKNNFLILDEPTNYIDIETKEMLEEALEDYQGTVLFISHDRYFINKLADKILYIQDKKLKEYYGNYDYYLEKIKEGN